MRKLFVFSAMLLAFYIALQELQDPWKTRPRPVVAESAGGRPEQLALPSIQLPLRAPSMTKAKKTAMETADAYLNDHQAEWKIQPFHQLRPEEFKTPLGTKIKYSVFQGQVPVIDMGVEIQLDRNQNVIDVQNQYRPLEKADMDNLLSLEEIVDRNSERYELHGEERLSPPVLFVRSGSNVPEAAYLISVKDKTRDARSVQILFRASDGHIISKSVSRSEF